MERPEELAASYLRFHPRGQSAVVRPIRREDSRAEVNVDHVSGRADSARFASARRSGAARAGERRGAVQLSPGRIAARAAERARAHA